MATETKKMKRASGGRVSFRRGARRGQALVEFAIIAFVLSAIVAGLLGILVLALGSFQNNIAAENAGRELDDHAVFIKENFVSHFEADDNEEDRFEATDDFENITARQVYRFLNEFPFDENDADRRLYDERRLIISPSDWENRTSLGLPAINESLLGQFIFDPDVVPEGATEQGAYRFPGAVVTRTIGTETYQTVLIPLLPNATDEDGDGATPPHGIDRSLFVTSEDPVDFFPVSNDWVAPVVIGRVEDGDDLQFRIIFFHPSQPASTIQLDLVRDDQGRITRQTPVEADDGAVDDLIGDPPSGYVLSPPGVNQAFGASSSRGQFGLGESFAFATTVRPFRLVFETSSIFRMKATPIVATYEFEENGSTGPSLVDESLDVHTTDAPVAPFVAYEDNNDQSLDLEQLVVDRFTEELRRYFVNFPLEPAASSDNDFVQNVVQLLPDDDGVWRVSVSAELQRTGASEWTDGHVLALRLYRNGLFERQIDQIICEPNDPPVVALRNDVLVPAVSGDILQVRVFTAEDPGSGSPPTYSVALTGSSETNWVSYERIGE